RHSPTRRPPEFLFAFAILKLNAARTRKILTEKMRCSGLDCPAILHHRFDREGLHRPGKTLALGFFAGENRHGQMIADKTFVKIDRKSTRLNSSHVSISYAVFCLKKKK